jgi:hypothetical protein
MDEVPTFVRLANGRTFIVARRGEVDKPIDQKRKQRLLTERGTSHFEPQAKLTTMRSSEHRVRA